MLLHDNPLVFTRHAERRAKARGLPWRIVSLICANADRRTHVGGGCLSLMVSKSELETLAGFIPAEDRERMQGVAVVLDPATETVVTVLHIRGRRGADTGGSAAVEAAARCPVSTPPPVPNSCPFNAKKRKTSHT